MKNVMIFCSLMVLSLVAGCIQAQPPMRERSPMPVQVAIDTDKDGVISADELRNASAGLRRLDKNGDGRLTEEEVRPEFDRERREGPQGNGNDQLVASLMSFDTNKDGQLSKSELPERMQGIFSRADANGDGHLTREELSKVAASQPSAGGGESRAVRPGGNEHDEHEERGPRGPGGFMRFIPMLAALDADKDGVIAAGEIDAAAKSLAGLDRNGDGRLTEDETRPPMGEGRGRFGGSPDEMVGRIFGEYDRNGDGRLSADELPERMREMTGRADTNRDGFISREELRQMAERGRPEGQRPPSR